MSCKYSVLFFLIALWVTTVSACTQVYGLKPEYPKLKYSFMDNSILFVEVDSLQPTLRWEPFIPPAEKKVDNEGVVSRFSEVTYELKIWRVEEDWHPFYVYFHHYPSDIIYFRQGIIEPYHRLEEPLKPATKYIWTVRASFKLDGHCRVTEWGLVNVHFPLPRLFEIVPEPNYYRFKTPPE